MDHAFTGDMVRQAGKWLQADDAAAFMIQKIDHVGGEEPAFAGAVAKRQVLGCSLGHLLDACDFMEAFGILHCLFQRLSVPFQDVAGEGILQVFPHGAVHELSLEMAVERTVEEEVKHAARFGFPAVRFDCMDDIVGCDRAELDVNFTDDADSRTARAVVEPGASSDPHGWAGGRSP